MPEYSKYHKKGKSDCCSGNSHCDVVTDKICEKLCADDWPRANRNSLNNGYNPDSHLTPYNVDSLEETARIHINANPNAEADIWANITATPDCYYLTTHNVENVDPSQPDQSFVIAIDRKTMQIKWRRVMSSYSGIPFDTTRGAPLYYDGKLFFGSNILSPQTYEPFTNIQSRFAPVPVPAKGRRTRAYCVDAETGDMIWERELGDVATSISDPDNFLTITATPVVVEVDIDGTGTKQPIVVFTTSSGQSFFPWIIREDTQPLFQEGLYSINDRVRMTDGGQVHFLDLYSGVTVAPVFRTTPPVLQAGDALPADSLLPGATHFKIHHYITPADIALGGDLNMIDPAYAVDTQNITWALLEGVDIPQALDEVEVMDNTGAVVSLVGGAVAGPNLNKVTVNVDATFDAGTTNFTVLETGQVHQTTVLANKLAGMGGLSQARICKWLEAGDTLDEQDAYYSNYYGATTWQSSPVVRYDEDCNAVELVIATGQSHTVPLDEVAALEEEAIKPFLDLLNDIYDAQQAFELNRTPTNLSAIRNAYAIYALNLRKLLNFQLSPRGQRHLANSVVLLNLRPGQIGQLLDSFRTIAQDVWFRGYQIDALKSSTSDGLNPVPGFSNVSKYYGYPRNADGDFGECPALLPGAAENGDDLLALATKGGYCGTLRLTKVADGPGSFVLVSEDICGNPGVLGGSNYGSAADHKKHYVCQLNAGDQNHYNLPFQTGGYNSNNPSAQGFMPPLAWYPVTESDPATIEPFAHFQSYLSARNVALGEVTFEVAVTPGDPLVSSLGNPSCADDLVMLADGAGFMRIFNSNNGKLLRSIDLGSGGFTAPLILKNELVMCSGRGFLASEFPDSNYKGTKYLYVYELPHHKRDNYRHCKYDHDDKSSCCKKHRSRHH